MNPNFLKDFPILVSELELADRIVLQKRLSQCGAMGVLTIRLMEKLLHPQGQKLPLAVVWFDFLDSPHIGFADCVNLVKSGLATRDIDLTAELPNLYDFQLLRDAIVTEGAEEMQAATRASSALLERSNSNAIESAKMMIEKSRTVVSRHRQLMESGEKQIKKCLERLVWSRMKISLLEESRDPTLSESALSADEEIRAIFEMRAMIGEERRVILEAEVAVAESAESWE